MEELNMKNHPSLPSNYVSILHLEQRWLKQQQQEEEKEQHQKQNLKQQGDPAVVVRTHETASRSGSKNHRTKQYRPKNRTDLGSGRRSIAGTRDQKADLESKGNESKKTEKEKVNRNPKLEEEKNERGRSEGSEISETEAKKSTIESESNQKKNGDATVDQVEQKFGGLSMNSGNGKNNWRFKRVNGGYGGRGYGYGGGHFGYGGFRRHNYEEQEQRGNKMVWVKKDCNVGGEI